MSDGGSLRQTALVELHRGLGARLIEFGGWEMPVQYRGIIEEHRAVRSAAGLFDLSHMGELWIAGPGAGDGLAGAIVTDPRTLALGRAQYSMICAPDGGIIDDLIVYRTGPEQCIDYEGAFAPAELQARCSLLATPARMYEPVPMLPPMITGWPTSR